jgi:two-component system response regulator
MYLLYASRNEQEIDFLDKMLFTIDRSKTLLAVPTGFDVLCYLQNVKKGQSYPALILIEMDMAPLTGKELLELLKTDDIYRLIPVVMLTSNTNHDDLNFCTRLGTDVIRKPITNAHWLNTLKRLCARCQD